MQLTAREIERMIAGTPVKEIARERGVSRQAVHLALRERGIQLRKVRPKAEPCPRRQPHKDQKTILLEKLLADRGLPFETIRVRTSKRSQFSFYVTVVNGKRCRLHILKSRNHGVGSTLYAATNISRAADIQIFYVETSQPPAIYIVPTKLLNPRRKRVIKVYIPVEGFSKRTQKNRWWEKWRDAWRLLNPETTQEAA